MKYLNEGDGDPWAAQDKDWAEDNEVRIFSVAADENFGADPPMGS